MMTSTHAKLPAFLPAFPMPPQLTPREGKVLALIALGYTNHEIADLLKIAPSTAKNHTLTIYRKLDVRGRTNVAILVWQSAYEQLAREPRMGAECSE